MTRAADPIEYEPFGQRGLRQMARPLFVGLCAVGVAISAAMILRSRGHYDVLWKQENYRRVEIASAIGRLMVTTRTHYRNPQNSGWVYESAEISGLDDGWRPSIWKTVGVEWGEESYTTYSGRVITMWRLRVQWRTLLIVYLVPVLIDALAKRVTQQRERRRLAEGYVSPAVG